MERLYAYLMNPSRTIQLFNHQKDWRVWWLIIAISALISMIKLSNIGIIPFMSQAILNLGWLVMTAIIIDASAQLLGQTSQLPSMLYWLGFANAFLWLSPSVRIIQHSFYSFGSLLIFAVNLICLYYIWETLKKVYTLNHWQRIGLFAVPFVSVLLFIVAIAIYAAQIAMVIQ
jgi:hypothetical protein